MIAENAPRLPITDYRLLTFLTLVLEFIYFFMVSY